MIYRFLTIRNGYAPYACLDVFDKEVKPGVLPLVSQKPMPTHMQTIESVRNPSFMQLDLLPNCMNWQAKTPALAKIADDRG
jgi:hypothetical protein